MGELNPPITPVGDGVEKLSRRPMLPPRIRRVLRAVLPWRLYKWVRRAFWRALPYFILGEQRECPFCRSRFRRFAPGNLDTKTFRRHDVIGGGFQSESVCLGCGSDERGRHVFLYLRDHTYVFDELRRVLHVGPDVVLSRCLRNCDKVDYVAGDLAPSLDQAATGIDARLDVCELPFQAASFDVVLCNHVLEHVPDDKEAVREIYRVLRSGGWAILQVPVAPSLRQTYENPDISSDEGRKAAFGLPGHVRLYGRDYGSRLREAGFDVLRFNLAEEEGLETARRYGVMEREDLYVATKP